MSIPHQFFDMHTLSIGEKVFTHLCQIMVSNSHHRHDDDIDEQPMDLSKRSSSLHNNAILAYQSLFNDANIFQLHGFSQSKRNTVIAQQADFIISQGATSTLKVQQLATCLRKLAPHSYDYPREVIELGGTQNVLHQLPISTGTFFHIEISYPMRKKLITHSQTMDRFTECLRYVL
ncbi:hypothetical protein PA25_08310 [Pseudoalteromonas sp. A25]|nr:hypothetical protein PA25_08310 [Pseudoalteromonas sp. A25]